MNCRITGNNDDGDGYGDPASPYCAMPQRDCDDGDPYVNPGAREQLEGSPTCDDGKDNDCDGLVDMDDPECTLACPARIVPVARGPIFWYLIPVFTILFLGRRLFGERP